MQSEFSTVWYFPPSNFKKTNLLSVEEVVDEEPEEDEAEGVTSMGVVEEEDVVVGCPSLSARCWCNLSIGR
jgi:hypothetical protein